MDKNNSIREVVSKILNDIFSKILFKIATKGNKEETIKKVMELSKQVDENSRFNPRGKASFIATKHFEQKKQRLFKLLDERCMGCGKKYFKDMTPENIDKYFTSQDNIAAAYVMSHPISAIKVFLKNKKARARSGAEMNELWLDVQKIFLNPSKDKRVRNIERILREKYSFKYVHLDNIEDAENVLKTVKFAKEHNVPLIENLVVTPFIKERMVGLNLPYSNTIFINTNKWMSCVESPIERLNCDKDFKDVIKASNINSELNQNSTLNSMHPYLHEFIHNENPQKELDVIIPEKYRKTVDELCEYAKQSFNKNNEEIRTELRVKQLLEKLKPDEEELLNLLQSAIPG